MAQGDLALPTVGTVSGLQAITRVNTALAALVSQNSGASAPANAAGGVPVAGQLWLDTTASPYVLSMYDGAQWIALGSLDTADDLWLPSLLTAARAYSAAQITQALDNLAASRRMTVGQCELVKNGSNITLLPRDGNLLTVNGKQCTIPDGGVSLAPTGLSVGSLLYIYAIESAGVVSALEASATVHATSTTAGNKGTEIKSGDDTRTLVGMVRPVTGPAFADSTTQRFVRSWFNRKRIALRGQMSSGGALGGSLAEISTTVRTEFLIWTGEAATFDAAIKWYNNAANAVITFAHAIDTSPDGVETALNGDGAGAYRQTAVHFASQSIAEGYHYHTLRGSLSNGSCTVADGTNTAGQIG